MRLKDVTEFCPAYSGGARNDTVAFVPMEALRYDSISQQEIPFDEARGKYTFFADGDLLFPRPPQQEIHAPQSHSRPSSDRLQAVSKNAFLII